MSSGRAVKPLTLLTIAQLGNLLGVDAKGHSLTALVKRGLCNAALRAGYLVVPDILPEYVSVSSDDMVTMVRRGQSEVLSGPYPAAQLLMELGMSIVMGNGHNEPSETRQLSSEIRQLSYVMERNFTFSDLEVRALTALKDLLSLYPPDTDRVASMLKRALPVEDCRKVARMMVTIGAAGSTRSGKVIALRKLYAVLDLNEKDLYQLMMSMCYAEPGVIEVEPLSGLNTPNLDRAYCPAVTLDLELVAEKKRETEFVSMMLAEIFAGGD
ncbi:MAG: hypothetical protein FWE55_05425 [Synergistaceae bacterium]|nr:hypothetical protein [Synergistaceae bacterium]